MAHGRRTEVELVRDGRGRLCVAVPLAGRYAYGATGTVRRLHPVGSMAEAKRYIEGLRSSGNGRLGGTR